MLQIDLSHRVAIVTGATGQLGRVMARTLAACGADIAIHFHSNEAKAHELHAEITAMGRRAAIVQADVARAEDVARMHQAVRKFLGDADIVVNNAVSQYEWTTVLEQAVEDYEDQFRSCVLQNVLMAKQFVPSMIEKGRGRIIGINTECAIQNFPTQSAYTAGKRGMDGVLRVLAKEIGPHGITVNQVAPGWTISDQHRESGAVAETSYEKTVPLRRRGTDQEIANVVAFLASDLASYITGAYVPVCGGNVMPAI
ncbi:MAG: 3-oxoacyl-[acyl-carrier protein] reductase [Abditibacteriota bacterium]|nr:3-oxoacyl-[acyl-carrier protein] reductase [Abditibacteriota bacterium]